MFLKVLQCSKSLRVLAGGSDTIDSE